MRREVVRGWEARRAVRRWGAGGAVLTSLLLVACGSSVSSDSGGSKASASSAVSAGCPDNGSQGVTDATVKVGASSALSGPAASGVPGGMQAYFDYVNSQGGVKMADGKTRKIEFKVYDDGYEPARARGNADKLINQDKVFALVGMYGTPGNLAARPLVDKACIPDIYMSSGHPEFGNPEHPWLAAPTAANYAGDGRAAARYISEHIPNAKVALLVQNDDLGKVYKNAFQGGLQGSHAQVVKETSFEPTDTAVSAQITTLAGTKADAFVMLAGAGTYQLQALESIAKTGWKPRIKYLTNFQGAFLDRLSPAAAQNVYYGSYSKDPAAPEFKNDATVKLFGTWWSKRSESKTFSALGGAAGWQIGLMFVDNLRTMKKPTREALLNAATHFTLKGPSLYLDGMTYSIDAPDRPYGMVDEAIMTYNPSGPKGGKSKQVTIIKQQGKVKYEPLS